jgi:GNAT superfamily N-acetyltransferase
MWTRYMLFGCIALISVYEIVSWTTIPKRFANGYVYQFLSDEPAIDKTSKTTFLPRELFDGRSTNGDSNFYIREGSFSDLCRVANIIVDSFYNPSIFVRPFLYAAELQRLQDNFPYDDQLHSYFVACSTKDDEAVGFVDIDARPTNHSDAPPRPYLHRRLGLAKTLVQKCELRVKEMGLNRMFLRVERDNNAARNMYANLGYDELNHPIFGVKDTTILLERRLDPKSR